MTNPSKSNESPRQIRRRLMSTRRRWTLFMASTLVTLAVVLIPESAAFAGCNPGRVNDGQTYFAGWITNNEPTTVTQNSANIYNYPNPYVAPGSGVFAWDMIVGPALNDYAQVGWVVDYNGRHTFIEWNVNGHVGSNFSITANTPGTTTWYEEYTTGGGTNYCFGDNGTQIGCSGTLGWKGLSGQDLGEIHTLADQMPGSYTVPEDWNNSFIFYYGSQYNFNGYLVYNSSYFNDNIYSQVHDQAGDADCYS